MKIIKAPYAGADWINIYPHLKQGDSVFPFSATIEVRGDKISMGFTLDKRSIEHTENVIAALQVAISIAKYGLVLPEGKSGEVSS